MLDKLLRMMPFGRTGPAGSTHGIFINYRRGQSAPFARALYNALAAEFGDSQVFMDVEDLREPGKDFVDEIQFSLDSCAAMLTLIDREWVGAKDKDGALRLRDPRDFVRLEIATALKRDVRVIPVLLENARMPEEEELPDDLTSLARRQALRLAHESWDHNVRDMIDGLARIPGMERKPPPDQAPPPARKSRTVIAALSVAVLAIGATALILLGTRDLFPDPKPTPGPLPDPRPPAPAPQPVVEDTTPPTPQYSANVYQAQQLLDQLEYNPGTADGYIGPATVAAIREFESDEGYRVSGRVTKTLLAQLEEALEYESGLDSDIYPTPVPTPTVSMPDLSGVWYDNAARAVLIEQNGSSLRVGSMNILTREVFQIGAGSYQNGTVTINYNNGGSTGTVVATLSPDGRHLVGTDTDAATGYTAPNAWHYDHLPH